MSYTFKKNNYKIELAPIDVNSTLSNKTTFETTYQDNITDYSMNDSSTITSKGDLSLYSNTSHSDLENIYISRLRVFTEELQNKCYKHPEYYDLICKVINENNLTLAEINNVECISSLLVNEGVSKEVIADIRQIYASVSTDNPNALFDNDFFNELGDFKNYILEEIVSEDSGFDAVVLKNPENGNISIENSCTNNKSLKDLSFIAYAMSKDLTGGTSLLTTIGRFFNLVPENITDGLTSLNGEDCEKIYYGQINDSIELIKKYSEQLEPGAKLELYGYSLGGGCMATSLATLMMENDTDVLDKIDSVTLYNPFLLIAEENDKDAVNKLVESDKLLIYSTQEDFVTEYNDIIDTLDQNGQVVYLNCESLEFNDIFDLASAVTGSAGNHGFSKIEDYNEIDENGNLKCKYDRVSLKDTTLKVNATANINSRQDAFYYLLSTLISENVKNSSNYALVNSITEQLLTYLCTHWGSSDKDFKTILGNIISDVLYDEVFYPKYKKMMDSIDDIKLLRFVTITPQFHLLNTKEFSEVILGKDNLNCAICNFLNNDDCYELFSKTIECYLNGDLNGYFLYYFTLCESLADMYEKEITIPDRVLSFDINTYVKNLFISQLKDISIDLFVNKYYESYDVTFSEDEIVRILYDMNEAGKINDIKYTHIEEPGSVSPENMEPVDIYDVMNHDATIADYVAQVKGVPRESDSNSKYSSLDYDSFRRELYEIYEKNGNGLTFEEYFEEKYKKELFELYCEDIWDSFSANEDNKKLIESMKPDLD